MQRLPSRALSSLSLRIATWNCAGVPGSLLAIVTGEPAAAERFDAAAIGRALDGVDVLCVQEAFVAASVRLLEGVARRLGLHLWRDGIGDDPARKRPFGSGLAILSRWPLAVEQQLFAGRPSGFDGWSHKAVAATTLTFDRSSFALHVVQTHLQSDDPPLSPEIFRAVRAAQIAEVVAAIDRRRAIDPSVPIVLAGDLNVRALDDEYASVLAPALAARGLGDVVVDPPDAPIATFAPSRNPLAARWSPDPRDVRVDHLWVGHGSAVRARPTSPVRTVLDAPIGRDVRGGPLFASDHFGLAIDLALERDG
jgi:endonuclease/exonuclease/phosphatase family metal-dependent hydrolase